MYGSSDYYNRQHGWDNTSPNGYNSHISRIARTPSVLTNAPHYPNVHMIFNKENWNGNQQQQQRQQQEIPPVEAQKKVHFVEETVEIEKDGPKREVCKKNFDVDETVEGFIQQRHKNFELCKWATFEL